MVRKTPSFIVYLLTLLFLIGCSPYQKILQGGDIKLKYQEAEKYYTSGDFKKANALFEQVKGKVNSAGQKQRLSYLLAETYYKNGNYNLASFEFENFIKSYPKSIKIPEAKFLTAKCYYKLSPRYSLDQKDTEIAIDKFQIFIDNYPTNENVEEASSIIQELQRKLEKKHFEIAKSYFTRTRYNAAIVSFDNFIANYPGTFYKEKALYFKFLSSYEIAFNSVLAKKIERLENLEKLHGTIFKYFPKSFYEEELNKKLAETQSEIELTNRILNLK